MEKVLLSFFLLLLNLVTNAQCPPSNITLTSQADVDNFKVNYSTCTEIDGDLIIKGSDITNLSPLQNLTSVFGSVIFSENTNLVSLNGLENLNFIGNTLSFRFNYKLSSLLGIRNIKTIKKSIKIRGSNSLVNLDGLSNIKTLETVLEIVDNYNLTSLSGLENLVFVPGVSLYGNWLLNDLLGLRSLSSVDRIGILDNNSLINLKGLENITSLKNLWISDNDKLVNLEGLDNLDIIDSRNGGLSIIENESLLNLTGLEKLKSIGKGGTLIQSNPKLSSLRALISLTDIGGDFYIENNDSLINLEGLDNLVSISETSALRIWDNASLISLSGLESLKSAGYYLSIRSNPLLSSMEALSGITQLEGVTIYGNGKLENLSGLENLASSLESIDIQGNEVLNNLIALRDVSSTIRGLNIERNPLLFSLDGLQNITDITNNLTLNMIPIANFIGLNNLKAVGGDVHIRSINNIINFSDLENLNSVGGELEVNSCESLSDFTGLNNLSSIGNRFYIYHNHSLSNFIGLDGLPHINGSLEINANFGLKNLNGLENLNSINGKFSIISNFELTDISGISNLDYASINALVIKYNNKLKVCYETSICDFVSSGEAAQITNNSNGCNSIEEIEANCNNLNIISGVVSFDISSNSCSSFSSLANNVKINTINTFGESFTTYSKADGSYRFVVQNGTYITNIEIDDSRFNTSQNNIETTFENLGNNQVIDFCLSRKIDENDVIVTLLPITEVRPGFGCIYQIIYENIGTKTANGNILFQYDGDLQTYISSSLASDTQTIGSLTYNYSDLKPLEKRTIYLNLKTEIPPIVNGGDILQLKAIINSNESDVNIIDNTFELNQIVVNSFDPNDKQVLEGSEIKIENVDEYIHYLIRFQNTGTANAINIRIRDVLDDKLDWNTFSPLSSSHNYYTRVSNENLIDFIFENILLPAEQDDEPNSNGFVAFKIKPKTDVVIGDVIAGKANIYFDFNLPIITNTVNTEITDNSLSTGENILEDSFRFYPNPVSNKLYLSNKPGVKVEKVKIYSVTGKLFLEDDEGSKEINLKSFPKGMYFLIVVFDKGSITRKIIKK